MFPNRTICDALREIRAFNEARSYGGLAGLVEEIQSMANRMEAALQDKHDLRSYRRQIKEARKELKEVKEKLDEKKEGLG